MKDGAPVDGLPFLAYAFLSSLIPCLVVFALLKSKRKRNAQPQGSERLIPLLFFTLYIVLVFYVTAAGTLYDLLRYGLDSFNAEQVNLIPFIMDSYTMQYVLNVIMFVPFGILLPAIWAGARKLPVTLAYGFGFSLLIELSQLLNHRATDVDDLIMNTAGALIGYAAYAVFSWMRPSARHAPESGKLVPLAYLAALFAGRFFLYNEFGLAQAIYGF